MLKSNQKEKVLTKTTNQFKSTMNKQKIHLRHSLMDLNTSQRDKTNHGITNDLHQKQKSDWSKFNPIVTSGPQQKQKSDGSETWQIQTQVFFPGSDYISYKAIGGESQILTARILRRLKVTLQNWQTIITVITSSETGVDIRLASTSITNPHCKGQIILRPDTLILIKVKRAYATSHSQKQKRYHTPRWVNS